MVLFVVLIIEASQPRCETLHGSLEFGMKIDKRP